MRQSGGPWEAARAGRPSFLQCRRVWRCTQSIENWSPDFGHNSLHKNSFLTGIFCYFSAGSVVATAL